MNIFSMANGAVGFGPTGVGANVLGFANRFQNSVANGLRTGRDTFAALAEIYNQDAAMQYARCIDGGDNEAFCRKMFDQMVARTSPNNIGGTQAAKSVLGVEPTTGTLAEGTPAYTLVNGADGAYNIATPVPSVSYEGGAPAQYQTRVPMPVPGVGYSEQPDPAAALGVQDYSFTPNYSLY
jgi:hypothetical protein